MTYTDAHAHLTSPAVYPQIDPILQRAQKAGVQRIVNICTDVETLNNGLALAEKYPWILNTAATTPHDVAEEGETFFPLVASSVNKLIAIGETGLDYHYEHSPRALQQKYLIDYFALARSSHLPIIFHCREAFPDLFALADDHYRDLPAVLHCFTGTLAEAKGVLDRGWYISFSGIITFKKSEALREVVAYAPLDQILIETDTPYLAPQSQRGKPNEPAFLPEIAATVAQIKNLSPQEIGAITSANAAKFFAFPKLS